MRKYNLLAGLDLYVGRALMNDNELLASNISNGRDLEQQRMKDLILQVESFLKFAVKGTSSTALAGEAAEFSKRLTNFLNDPSYSKKIRRLLTKLKKIEESA
jgi:hypothetical protein